MKKMAKIVTALLSAVFLCVGSACNLWEDRGTIHVPPEKLPSTTFTVEYDYGQIVEGKATLLLSGNSLFFDPEHYNGLAPLIAGDEIEVSYDGELLLQETYPGTVVVKGTLSLIEKTKVATTMGVSFDGGTDGKIRDGDLTFVDLPEYVIERDSSITPLSEVEIGTTLFLAYVDEGQEELDVTAIYAYSFDYPLTANEVIPWAAELSAENVVEIEEKTFNASVGPNGLIEIRKTENKGGIESLLSYFQHALYREAVNGEEEIDGGEKRIFTIRTAEKEYVYSTYAGYYSNENGCYYPERQAPTITGGERFLQFFMTDTECTLFVDGKEVKTYAQSLTGYTFKHIQEVPSFPEKKYVLVCGNWQLYLMDERRFLLNFQGSDEPFELVGEKDFSAFIYEGENQ